MSHRRSLLALGSLAALLPACHLVVSHRGSGGPAAREGGPVDRSAGERAPLPDLGCLLPGSNGCRSFAPSNGAPKPELVCGPLVIKPPALTLDTTACTLAGCSAGTATSTTLCVVEAGSLRVEPSATLRVIGKRALVLLVSGAAHVDGLIDLGARGAEAGAGGGAGGTPGTVKLQIGSDGAGPGRGVACHCPTESDDDCGGSGASYASKGGRGGEDGCSSPGRPGETYGSASLEPLLGGSGGASGSEQEKPGPAGLGGAGGGALQLSAQGGIWLAGAVNAGGGGGLGAKNCVPGPKCSLGAAGEGGGGGGGSGGAILLEAPLIQGGGWVAVNGGGGGGGAVFGDGAAGEDGRADATVARGGAGASGATDAGVKSAGAGGSGAAGAPPGLVEASAGVKGNSHGGGGGGVGRVRLRTSPLHGPPLVKVSGALASDELVAN